MSSRKYTAQLNNTNSNKLTEPKESIIDLTEPAACLSDSHSSSKPSTVTEGGITHKKKKRKSGAEELWKGIKKRQTSGKMKDKQMEFATKLAEFEVVHDELEASKADAAATYLAKVPKPEWIEKPNKRPNWAHVYEGNNGSKNTAAVEQFAKITKLAECMKHMHIEVHPHTLRSWYLEGLEGGAAGLGLRVTTADLSPGAVAFTRTMPRELISDQNSLSLSNVRCNSLRYLYIQCASEIAAHIARDELTGHMAARQRLLGGQITLLVLDTQKYFKNGKPKQDLEAAIVDLLVSLEIDTLVLRSAEELVSTVLQFTRAVAEEPHKLAKRAVDEQAEFYMRGDNKNCVIVDQKGNGLSRLWQQMLTVLPHSSLEMARAIDTYCSTPKLMAEVVSTEEGVTRLGNLGVSRSAAPGARGRRLGTEFTRRMQILFTSLDGDQIVE